MSCRTGTVSDVGQSLSRLGNKGVAEAGLEREKEKEKLKVC
jgi:hypothetical protein